MSAYVVDTELIEQILEFIASDVQQGQVVSRQNGQPGGIVRNGIAARVFTNYDLQNPVGLSELGNDLLAMNQDSVMQRYPDRDATDAPGIDTRPIEWHEGKHDLVNQVEAYKLMRGLIYQSCEGDVPERDPLFADLEEYAYRTAAAVVTSTDEYEQAEWSR